MFSEFDILNLHQEVTHFYNSDNDDFIASKGNVFFGSLNGFTFRFKIPISNLVLSLLVNIRFFRRLFRLDKSNVIYCDVENVLYVVYLGNIYLFNMRTGICKRVHSLRQSRNTLHNGACLVDGSIYIGEYGNSGLSGVPIWKGRLENWEMVFSFPPGKIRHVHGVYADPYENKIWVTTGDHDGECFLLYTDNEFSTVNYLGDGTQNFRSVGLIFSGSKVFWATDSPLVENKLFCYDKITGVIEEIQQSFLKGPVWYVKQCRDGFLLQTSVEKGPAVHTNEVQVFCSKDLHTWSMVFSVKKDMFPYPIFKNGVIAFSDGPQYLSKVICHAEAVHKLDGKSFVLKVNNFDS